MITPTVTHIRITRSQAELLYQLLPDHLDHIQTEHFHEQFPTVESYADYMGWSIVDAANLMPVLMSQ